ncbi:hypothetical protein ACEQ8H_003537 [Pleosporales sp. CAS-2024a]
MAPKAKATRDGSGRFTSKAPATSARPTMAVQMQTQAQTQPTTNTTTTTAQQITVATSTEVVQTLTKAVTTSLVRFRRILDEEVFDTAAISYVKPSINPESRAEEGSLPAELKTFQIDILKRNVSQRANQLLDLLDGGIAHSIREGYLKNLRFIITESSCGPDERLEEWTLGFSYGKSNTEKFVSSMHLKEIVHNKTIDLNAAKRGLNLFISDLTNICKRVLPDLPPLIKMYIDLEFNENAPSGWCPRGFNQYIAEDIRFAESDVWEYRTTTTSHLNTNHHSLQLDIKHLALAVDHHSETVPAGLPYTNRINPIPAVNAEPKQSAALGPLDQSHQVTCQPVFRSAPPHNDDCPSSARSAKRDSNGQNQAKKARISNTLDLSSSDQFVEDLTMPSSTDLAIKKKVASMLPPARPSAVLHNTQPRSQDDERTGCVAPLVFRQEKIRELEAEHIDRPLDVCFQKILQDKDDQSGIEVYCMCGSSSKDDSLIFCEYCHTYQHVHCCGYSSGNDRRIAAKHVCYQCLFVDEPMVRKEMAERIIVRRAVFLLFERGFDNKVQLAKTLGCTETATSKVLRNLKEEGFITIAGNSRWSIHVNKSAQSLAKMAEVHFNPTAGMTAYLEEASRAVDGTKTPVGPATERMARKRPLEKESDEYTTDLQSSAYSERALSQAIFGSNFATPKRRAGN